MRVAFYARVSTERQEQQGTIASQLDALRRYAQEHSHEVVDAYVCVDDGYSGSRLDRPGLDRMRDGAEARAFEAVLVLCPDRLARKYAYQVLILEELERFGVRVIFLEQPPSEDPHARLLVQIQGAIAEYERMKIAERYRRGKLFRARQGEMVCWKVPYGYRRVPRRDGVPAHVEIAEPEAQVVRQIFAWHVHDRLSIRQIALRLTESAHLSATGLTRWGTSTVNRMLRNEAYVGTMYFNRHESLDGDPKTAGRRRSLKSRTRCRPASEWVPISVPPLISTELFQRSQALHPDNSRFSPRHLKSGHYLLRGLVRCRVCDLRTSCHRMRGRDGNFHHYYYCAGHDLLRARRQVGRCPQRNIRADELDDLVWAEVCRHLESPALILEAYTRLRAEPVPRADSVVAEEIRELQKKLAELDREEHRLLDAYQVGLIALDQLDRRQTLLRQRRADVQASLEAVRGEHTVALQQTDLQRSIESFARSIHEPLATLPFEARQRLVRTVIERVMVEAGRVDVHFAIPLDLPKGHPPDGPGQVSTDFRLRSHHSADLGVVDQAVDQGFMR
jgi:site-specific DNA recombinase